MLFMIITTWEPDKQGEVNKRAREGFRVIEGVKGIGMYNALAGGRAWAIVETDDPMGLAEGVADWYDIQRIEIVPIMSLEGTIESISK